MANSIKILNTFFGVGDEIKVHQKVKEAGKERVQVFEGIVIAIKGSGDGTSFICRKISSSVGVERIWPANCPSLIKIEVVKSQPARRAKLYYLRNRIGKQALKIKESGGNKRTDKEPPQKAVK